MKIYVSHSADFDYINELYKPLRGSKLNIEHSFFLPHEHEKLIDTQDIIKSSYLILAEVSFPSTGQGIELGWASLLKVPIVCISRKDLRVSAALRYVTDKFMTYTDSADFINQVSDFLGN